MMDRSNSRADAFNKWAEARDWPARCDPDLSFESPALTDLLNIWRELAGADEVPPRQRMTARVLKAHLRYIAIIERLQGAPLRHRVRLMGTRLSQILGEMQGRYLEEALDQEVFLHWQARLDLALAERRPVRFVSRVDLKQLYFFRSESFWAPLTCHHAEPSCVLMAAILTFNTPAASDDTAALARIA